MSNRAVFLDRDGTIIADDGYIDDPRRVRLLRGSAKAIRRFADAGYLVVVVSNQSGVARGLFDEQALSRVHARLEELLGKEDARLDGAYYCPYLAGPEAKVLVYREDSDLRKPKPGMLLQAAEELDIDLHRSWMIGDEARDVQAGDRAGCRTIWIMAKNKGVSDSDGSVAGAGVEGRVRPAYTATDILQAAQIVEQEMQEDRPDPSANASRADDERVVQALNRIHDQLERAHRPQHQQDFSLLRLFGALLQMFALVAALWGAVPLLGDDPVLATARFALACFLQLAAISAFAIDRFR